MSQVCLHRIGDVAAVSGDLLTAPVTYVSGTTGTLREGARQPATKHVRVAAD